MALTLQPCDAGGLAGGDDRAGARQRSGADGDVRPIDAMYNALDRLNPAAW